MLDIVPLPLMEAIIKMTGNVISDLSTYAFPKSIRDDTLC